MPAPIAALPCDQPLPPMNRLLQLPPFRIPPTVRRSTVHCLLPLLLLLAASPSPASEPVAASASEWTSDMHRWLIEQMPGGTVTVHDGALVIDDDAGCTVWLREKLTAPVVITYDATVVARVGFNDRVSDLNCFWMARDPTADDGCPFAAGHGRSGKFSDYDSLLTYYVGCGGNGNSTTRFRRYDGTPVRPLLPEHDLSEKRFLLEANKTYRIKLVARDGVAEFWRDGEKIFSYRDPAPLTDGWFAFRTVKSHLEIRHFRVEQPAPSTPKKADGLTTNPH